MSLYSEDDSKLLDERIEDILKEADVVSSKLVEPTKDKVWEIIYIVRDFVIEKKRKIYGGFALNKLIEQIEPKDKFYDDDNVDSWDIDFYSPDPISDAKEIANRLYGKGFRHIVAREAQHDETYKVFAETKDCADITYVPRNIYNKMPFKEVNGMQLTGPHFLMIDYFRVLTDPLTSYVIRLQKTFDRLCLMVKHYPLPYNTSSIDIVPPDRDLDVAFHTVHEFLTNRQSTITVGLYAYNHLIRESGISEEKKKNKIDYIDINYYEVISTEYKSDARDLILKLKEKFSVSPDRVTYQENYPFFQYLGYSVNIYFDEEIICRMYNYNSRCTPYFDVPALYFKKSSYDDNEGTIRIGSFATLMMYNLIDIMKARTDNDQNTKNLYYTVISHITDMKKYYFEKTKKTIFDDSLFKEFILRCAGNTMTPQMEKTIRMDKKKKAGKRYAWNYAPENDKGRESDVRYIFKNSSGNPIRNEKNKKISLTESQSTDNDVDNIEDEDENEN